MVKPSLTCYMCEKPATSVEHAPPKCIFPELKDIPDSVNRREDLITVPSCDEHNSEKSKDDEYLLYVLSLSTTSNYIGRTQALTKIQRAVTRKPKLFNQLSIDATPTQLTNFNSNEEMDVVALFPEADRINSVLEKCAKALYFHATGNKFVGAAILINGFLIHSQENSENKLKTFEAVESFLSRYPYLGKYPDTFKYKICHENESAMLLFEFYGSSKAIVDLRPNKQA